MRNTELVSIIVPVYNVEKYLTRCVDSLLAQTYQNIEILLIDDGSTDSSGNICDKYLGVENIKIYHKPNEGLSSARNFGLDRIEGEYIAFVDSDDWVSPTYVEYLYKILKENVADIARCEFDRVKFETDFEGLKEGEIICCTGKEALRLMLRQEKGMNTSVCTSLFNKKLFEKDCFPEGRVFEDLGTTYKLLSKAEKVVISSAKLYAYFTRVNSIAHTTFKIEYMDELYFAKEIESFVKQIYPDLLLDALFRKVGVCFHLYMLMSKEQLNNYEYKSCVAEIQGIIKSNRWKLLRDKQGVVKVRAGCLCSFLGMKFVRYIYNLLGIYGT